MSDPERWGVPEPKGSGPLSVTARGARVRGGEGCGDCER